MNKDKLIHLATTAYSATAHLIGNRSGKIEVCEGTWVSVYSIHLWLLMPSYFMPQTSEKQERPTYWVDSVDKFSGLAELHEALPEVIQWSLHQNLLLLVVIQQVIPKWLFRQSFWVPNNNHPIPMEEQTAKIRSALTKNRTGYTVLLEQQQMKALQRSL